METEVKKIFIEELKAKSYDDKHAAMLTDFAVEVYGDIIRKNRMGVIEYAERSMGSSK